MEYYMSENNVVLRLIRSPKGNNYFEVYSKNSWITESSITYDDWAKRKISLTPLKADKLNKVLKKRS